MVSKIFNLFVIGSIFIGLIAVGTAQAGRVIYKEDPNYPGKLIEHRVEDGCCAGAIIQVGYSCYDNCAGRFFQISSDDIESALEAFNDSGIEFSVICESENSLLSVNSSQKELAFSVLNESDILFEIH